MQPSLTVALCGILRDDEAVGLGLPTGSRVEGALSAAAPLALSCWRGRASLNILVAKPECATLADKLRLAIAAHTTPPVSALNPNAQVGPLTTPHSSPIWL